MNTHAPEEQDLVEQRTVNACSQPARFHGFRCLWRLDDFHYPSLPNQVQARERSVAEAAPVRTLVEDEQITAEPLVSEKGCCNTRIDTDRHCHDSGPGPPPGLHAAQLVGFAFAPQEIGTPERPAQYYLSRGRGPERRGPVTLREALEPSREKIGCCREHQQSRDELSHRPPMRATAQTFGAGELGWTK